MGILSPHRLQLCGVSGGDVLIESGSAGGRNLCRVTHLFDQCHTIELDRKSFVRGYHRLKSRPNVTCHWGNSPEILPKIIDPQRETCLFLDAHFLGGPGKVSVGPQCPLMGELRAIFQFTWKTAPVIIVDDARMFGEWYWWKRCLGSGYIKSHWPRLAEIEELVGAFGFEVQPVKGMLLIAKERG